MKCIFKYDTFFVKIKVIGQKKVKQFGFSVFYSIEKMFIKDLDHGAPFFNLRITAYKVIIILYLIL